jgi:hypothetical protein
MSSHIGERESGMRFPGARSLARFAVLVLLASLFIAPSTNAQQSSSPQMSLPESSAPVASAESSAHAGAATTSNALPTVSALDTHRTTSAAASTGHLTPLPLAFETNAGQDNASVRFKVRSTGGTVFFRPNEVVLALRQPTSDNNRTTRASTPRAGNVRPCCA